MRSRSGWGFTRRSATRRAGVSCDDFFRRRAPPARIPPRAASAPASPAFSRMAFETSAEPTPSATLPAAKNAPTFSGRHAAGRHDAQHRQRSEQCFDVARPVKLGGKKLHEIRAGFVGEQTFGGREGAAGNRLVEPLAGGDDFRLRDRRDDEFRTRGHCGAATVSGSMHAAHAHQDFFAETRRDLAR